MVKRIEAMSGKVLLPRIVLMLLIIISRVVSAVPDFGSEIREIRERKEIKKNKLIEKRSFKILCVFGGFPLLSEVPSLNILTGLIDRGHDVYVYAYVGKDETIVHPAVTEYKLLERAYYKELPADIHEYDIIMCQFGPLGKVFLEIKKKLGLKAKIVTCFRGFDISLEIRLGGRHTYDSLFKEGDYFLPVCNYFKDILIELGCPEDKIRVHHSAIDLKRFVLSDKSKNNRNSNSIGKNSKDMGAVIGKNEKDEKITIVTVSRLVPKKGLDYSVLAVASLLKKYPQIQYFIMGGGSLEGKLRSLIYRQKAGSNITLLGAGDHNTVLELLNRADIFVLSSLTDQDGNEEGIPNALKEAMSVGIPVVSTYHAGISELVENGKTGLLVPCASAVELAEKIEYLIKNKQEAAIMGLAGHEHVQKEYDTEKLNDQLVGIFYSLFD